MFSSVEGFTQCYVRFTALPQIPGSVVMHWVTIGHKMGQAAVAAEQRIAVESVFSVMGFGDMTHPCADESI